MHNPGRPAVVVSPTAVVVSTGVSMYLTPGADETGLRQMAGLAPGSTPAMIFLVPPEPYDDELRPGFEATERTPRGRIICRSV